MTWVSISLSLWLILVGARRVNSGYKEAVVMERGPVPPSASSSCTYIGGDNRDQYRRCPPSTRWRWFHGHPTHIYMMKLWIICFVRLSIFCFEQKVWWWWCCRRHALHLLLLIYTYIRKLWIALCFFALNKKYDQWWLHVLRSTMTLCPWCDCFSRLSIFCSKLWASFKFVLVVSSDHQLRKWFQPATETLSIICSKQVLWAGFKFVLLSHMINYASDFNAPEMRGIKKICIHAFIKKWFFFFFLNEKKD